MTKTIELTKEGLDKLHEELKERSTIIRKELVDTLDEMRSDGDLSENEGYTLSLEKFQENETRIAELEELIKKAKVVKSCKNNSVCIGATVILELAGSKDKLEYKIVNESIISI